MTKPLDPEFKGLRMIVRAFRIIPPEAHRRILEWLWGRYEQYRKVA